MATSTAQIFQRNADSAPNLHANGAIIKQRKPPVAVSMGLSSTHRLKEAAGASESESALWQPGASAVKSAAKKPSVTESMRPSSAGKFSHAGASAVKSARKPSDAKSMVSSAAESSKAVADAVKPAVAQALSYDD